jgi:hypothetical protein
MWIKYNYVSVCCSPNQEVSISVPNDCGMIMHRKSVFPILSDKKLARCTSYKPRILHIRLYIGDSINLKDNYCLN